MQISSMLDALIILFTLAGHIKILLRTVTTTYTSSQLMNLFLKLELLMIGSHNIFKVTMFLRQGMLRPHPTGSANLGTFPPLR